MKTIKKREKCCRRCFAYIPFNSRKCQFCGVVFKSPGKYLFDIIKQALKIDRAYALNKTATHPEQSSFFTGLEVENLTKLQNIKIQMYVVLDDLTFLDETSLVKLCETGSVRNQEQ